jgi:cyanophycinase
MKIHYYLDWFNNGFPEKLAGLLQGDIKERKSLVMISTEPNDDRYSHEDALDVHEKGWFDDAGIVFEEYYSIDPGTNAEDAQRWVKNASVIFLCGGWPANQMKTMVKCGLVDLLGESDAIVMGTSGGGINMSTKWMGVRHHEDKGVTTKERVHHGLALDKLSFEPHFDLGNTQLIEADMFPLSEEIDIYVTDQGAVRIKDGKIDIIGDVHLISKSKICKLDETI